MFNWVISLFGFGGGGGGGFGGGLGGGALEYAKEYAIEEYVQEGIAEALAEMEAMVGNAGQQAIYEKYIIDAFTAAAEQKLIMEHGDFLKVNDIEMPYIEAVEIILQAGCDIVNGYYEQALDKEVWFDFL